MLKTPKLSLVLSGLLLLTAAALPVVAQSSATPAKTPAKPLVKPAPQKTAPSKPASATAAKAAPAAAAAAVAPALSAGQQETASRVMVGTAQCEFGEQVHIVADDHKPGHFRLHHKADVYNLAPEATTTGAVRLEDKRKGIMWLQIPSKSMLMNTKIGQRMIDNCLMGQQTG